MYIDNLELKRLDTIILDKQQLDKLLLWRDNNKDHVRHFRTVLENVIIEIDNMSKIIFCDSGSNIDYKFYINNIYIASFTFSRLTNTMDNWNINNNSVELSSDTASAGMIKLLSKKINDKLNNVEELIRDIITTHASIMGYMQYHKTQITEVIKPIKKLSKHKQNEIRKYKTSNNHIIKLEKIVYKFPTVDAIITKKLTKREIKLESWSVRGHNRKLKNGNVIFVKPYVKGSKENTQAKKYTIQLK